MTDEGKPYAPVRFDAIIDECRFISKNIHTSYNECLDLTPKERKKLISSIVDELKRSAEKIDKITKEAQQNRNKNR